MAKFKFTMLFESVTNASGLAYGSRVAGWSESVYADSITSADFDGLQQKRAACLSLGCRIVGQRTQQVAPVGRSNSTGIIYSPAVGVASDYPGLALFCTANAQAAGNTRRFTVRGIPDAMVKEGEFNPAGIPFWETLTLKPYLRELGNGIWKFPGRDLTIQPSQLVSIAADGTAITPDAHGLNPGDKVRIKRTGDDFDNLYSGVFLCGTGTTGVTIKLVDWVGAATTGGTYLDVTAKSFFAMDPLSIKVARVINKKPGRPFSGFRGRASKKRR